MLIILAAITIKSVIDYRIVEKTVVSAQKYDKEGARELLTVTLADIMTCKVTDNKNYNEKEYIDKKIRQAGMEIIDDIVIVGKYNFEIDRSVPKIGEYLGIGHQNDKIKIVVKMTDTDNDTNAKLGIEIAYEGEISEVIVKGERLEIPSPVNEVYSLDKEVTENGIYTVKGT